MVDIDEFEALVKRLVAIRDDVKGCRVYHDSKTEQYTIVRGKWNGSGDSVVRYEPFVLSAQMRYTVTGGPVFGLRGGACRFQIQPIETDNRIDPIQKGAPKYVVDGGLLAVPFPATVTVVWPDLDPTSSGKIDWTLTTYGPKYSESLPVLGVSEWHETRYLTDAQTIPLPSEVTRVLVPDSDYGVRVSLYGGSVRIEAPLTPVSVMGSPDLKVEILAALSGTVAPTHVPVLLMY